MSNSIKLKDQYLLNKKTLEQKYTQELILIFEEWIHNYKQYLISTISHGDIPNTLYLYDNDILNKEIVDTPEFKFKFDLHNFAFHELLVGETNVDDAHKSKSRSKYEKTAMLYTALVVAKVVFTDLDYLFMLSDKTKQFKQWLEQEGLMLDVNCLESNISFFEYPVYSINIKIIN